MVEEALEVTEDKVLAHQRQQHEAMLALHEAGKITVCDRWRDDATVAWKINAGLLRFIKDLGPAPTPDHVATFNPPAEFPFTDEWSERTVTWSRLDDNLGLVAGKHYSPKVSRRIARHGGVHPARPIRKCICPETGELLGGTE